MIELKEHPKLRDEMISFLKKWGKLANYYQQVLCNPCSKIWYNPLLLNSSDLDVESLLSQESGLDKFMKQMLDLLCDNHFCKQISTIFICSRLHYGL
jgi:hypothetical protein